MENERLTLSVEEASRILGIGRSIGYDLARQGKLPVLRFGKRILVSRPRLLRMIDNGNEGLTNDK